MPRSALTAALTLCLAALAAGPRSAYALVPTPAPPAVAAHSYLLVDHFSGRILAQSHADERAEPASLTKLMTAYVIFQALTEGRLKLTDPLTVSEHARPTGGPRRFVPLGIQTPPHIPLTAPILQPTTAP